MRSVLAAAFAVALGSAGTALAEGDPQAGKVKAQACAQCHGPDGNSTVSTFPKLAGQHADYIVHTLVAYKSGERKNAIMAGFSANLTAEDRADLGAWFASQPNGLVTVETNR